MPALIKVRWHWWKDKDGPHPIMPSNLGADKWVWTSKRTIRIQLGISWSWLNILPHCQSLNTAQISFQSCLYFMFSNDVSLIVISFLSNQKLFPRLRLMWQQAPNPHPQALLSKSQLLPPRWWPCDISPSLTNGRAYNKYSSENEC